MKISQSGLFLSFAVAVSIGLIGSSAQAQSDWDWGAEIYLWGADIGGETATGSDVDIGFDTLIDNLDMGFMGAIAAHNGPWTIFADLIYLNVGDSTDGTVNVSSGPTQAELDVKLKGVISTAGAAYKISETETASLNVLGGVRYLWLETDVDLTVGGMPGEVSEKDTSWDAVVGLRGDVDLSKNWYLTYYADIGAGQSDLTWQLLAAVNYRFNNFDVVLGYRYLDWEFDDFGSFDNLNISGPFLGAKIQF